MKFRVTDNGSPARSHEIVVPITITRNYETTRDAPVANSESYQLQHDQPFDSRNYNTDIGHRSLLDNDSWFDGQLPQITIVQQPAHGTVVVDAYGHFTYTPHAGVVFAGLDTFRYRLTDRAQGNYTHETTVSLHIHNAEPAGVDRWYNASQGRQLQVSTSNGVLNDIFTDGDGDATKATVSEPPAHGTVTLGVDGDFTYTPNPGFWGTDSFVIKLDERDALKKYFENIEATFSDDREQYAIVHLNVAQNSPPTANDDDYTIPFVAGSLAVNAIDGVLANDFDPDGAIEDLVALLVAGSPASTGFTSTGC